MSGFPNASQKLVSIVVPMFNEQDVIFACYKRLCQVAVKEQYRFEFIFVDDGSVDRSASLVRDYQRNDKRVVLLTLSRNFGKEAAMSAGLERAKGDAVVIIDADLQDPPELIPAMLEVWHEGAEVVCMRRRQRQGETWIKKTFAHCFYRILNYLSDVEIPQDVGDFRLMSRQAVDAVNSMPERNRYMKGVFAWIGYSPVYLEYDRDARYAGESKWGLLSLLKLAFEGITSFSIAPLRWMTAMGLIAAIGGFSFGVWIIVKTLVFGEPVAGYPSLVALLTFIGGVQLFSIGLLGIYVGKSYTEAKQRPLYLIQNMADRSSQFGSQTAPGVVVVRQAN